MGEIHLHGQDADILGAGFGVVVGSGAVGVDAVGSGHVQQRAGVVRRRGGGGGRIRKEGIGGEAL